MRSDRRCVDDIFEKKFHYVRFRIPRFRRKPRNLETHCWGIGVSGQARGLGLCLHSARLSNASAAWTRGSGRFGNRRGVEAGALFLPVGRLLCGGARCGTKFWRPRADRVRHYVLGDRHCIVNDVDAHVIAHCTGDADSNCSHVTRE